MSDYLIPPPPREEKITEQVWLNWFHLMWRRTKGLEPGESGGGDSNAIHDNVDAEINALGGLGSPADADEFILEDASEGYSKAKVTITAAAPPIQGPSIGMNSVTPAKAASAGANGILKISNPTKQR